MKFRASMLAIAASSALALTGCGKALDFRNAEISSGKIFESGENSPFSGRVTNIPSGKFMVGRPGVQQLFKLMAKTVPNEPDRYMDKVLFGTSLCDIRVRKGLLDGSVTCRVGEGDVPKLQLAFKDGVVDGEFKVFDLTPEKNTVLEAKFENGNIVGSMQMYSPQGKKLISRSHWVDGQLDGDEELFYADTGGLFARRPYKNGRMHGKAVVYAGDSKTILATAENVEGEKDGISEEFYPGTGKIKSHSEWKRGTQMGRYQLWDEDGKLTTNQVFVQGVLRSADEPVATAPAMAPAVPGPNLDACVGKWMDAFHKEKGKDAVIASDQLDEWQDWCKNGKAPQ